MANGASGDRSAAPRKKKITRLVPPEEPLAPIEEVTDRSEDSSIVSESFVSPYRPSGRPARIKDATSEMQQQSTQQETNHQPTPTLVNAMTTEKTGTSRDSAPKPPPSRSKDLVISATAASTPSSDSAELLDAASSLPQVGLGSAVEPTVIAASAQTEPPASQSPVSRVRSNSGPIDQPSSDTPSGTSAPADETTPETDQEQVEATHSPSVLPTIADKPVADSGKAAATTSATHTNLSVAATDQQATAETTDDELSVDMVVQSEVNSIMKSIDDLNGSSKEMEASKADFSSLLGDSAGLTSMQDGSDSDAMFDFDDDDAEHNVDDDKEERLTWRLDPSLSLSDWAINVRNKKDGVTNSYHVHKNMLAVGPRKCEYFVKSFRNIAKASVQNNTAWPMSCEIELEDVGARVFPCFLDYIYSPDGSLDIKTENATGLRYLSNFFGIRALHKRVMEFVQKDLALATMSIYYKDLHTLKDEKLLANAAKYCAKNVMKIETSYPSLKHWDPTFLLQIMQSSYIDSKPRHLHLSLLLAEYCRLRKGKLHASDFAMLTDEKVLPLIHYNAALTLMEVESDIVVATSLKNMLELSSLQKRCIKDLSTHWKELCDMDEAHVTRVCRKLPCSVVADLMMKSLSNAKRRTHSDLSQDGPAAGDGAAGKLRKGKKPPDPAAKLKKDYDAKAEELKKQYEEQVEKLKKESEAKLYMARQMLAQKDKQLVFQMHELRSFERLPNAYDGKLTPTGRSHEPSLLPENARDKAEGMLLVSKKNGPKYPLFYYRRKETDLSQASESSKKEQKP